ncbi:MFS transporter [Frigoribacterium faeni]|uniref:MFS family permease n=1 Tax=Frigoribacterium faeni TaxID=145483 RepID=A0A7W3PIU8_9MICO|nr:MFS transporter [Frigoribacterium faeni]MBA8813044.1 MFS family permease [Frigoribacterium faeni]BFF14225.1 MFS transporter [Microbacterium flavescens]GEK84701.1 MFS transporter [Frigoribacterium faeni]
MSAPPRTAAPSPATEPLPVMAERPPWRHTFIALSVPNFRIWTAGNVVAMTAGWMQRIAQDWLVLELTGSATAVGITVALQFAPMLFFGLLGGVIVDRFSKRALMIATQSTFAVLSLGLAALTLAGAVEAWHVFAIAFATGLVTVIDNPARQVIVSELVGHRHLRNAISVNSSVFQLGGMIGPAISGVLLLAVGAGWAFVVNGVACALVVVMLSMLRTAEMTRTVPAARSRGQLRAGLAYAAAKPTILVPVVLVASYAVFGLTMPVLLASFAADVYDVGAGGYGLFNSMIAVGALTGALLSTRRATIRLRTIVLGLLATGTLQAVAGSMPTVGAFAVTLVAVGLASLLFLTAANQLVQLSSNIAIRGRVMSLYVLVLLGGQAIGGPVMGVVVESVGTHAAMVLSGGVPAVVAAITALVLARRGQLTLQMRVRRHVPVVEIAHR